MTGEGWLPGYIQDYDGQALTLVVPFSDAEYLTTHGVTECSVRVEDGRRISAVQRRKIYALLRDIADWTGYEPQELKELMKYDFLSQCEDGTQYFSLSDADMTTARSFITYLIEFCVVHAVPCKVSLLQQCEDIEKYVYACVAHRRCAICGQKDPRSGAGRHGTRPPENPSPGTAGGTALPAAPRRGGPARPKELRREVPPAGNPAG